MKLCIQSSVMLWHRISSRFSESLAKPIGNQADPIIWSSKFFSLLVYMLCYFDCCVNLPVWWFIDILICKSVSILTAWLRTGQLVVWPIFELVISQHPFSHVKGDHKIPIAQSVNHPKCILKMAVHEPSSCKLVCPRIIWLPDSMDIFGVCTCNDVRVYRVHVFFANGWCYNVQ